MLIHFVIADFLFFQRTQMLLLRSLLWKIIRNVSAYRAVLRLIHQLIVILVDLAHNFFTVS